MPDPFIASITVQPKVNIGCSFYISPSFLVLTPENPPSAFMAFLHI